MKKENTSLLLRRLDKQSCSESTAGPSTLSSARGRAEELQSHFRQPLWERHYLSPSILHQRSLGPRPRQGGVSRTPSMITEST